MIGKYSKEQIQELLKIVKEGGDVKKEFWQARSLLIKQEGKILGNHNKQASLIEVLHNLKDKINLEKPFRIYIISAKEIISVKNALSKDSLEFSYMTYKGFSPAYELEGEKIALVENLLRKHRLPIDLWSKPGFQLWRWETQVFDVSAIGEAKEVM